MNFIALKNNTIKESIVAVGLAEKKSNNPSVILGSGFIINKEGFVLTAKHVITATINLLVNYPEHEVASFYITIEQNKISVNKLSCKNYALIIPDEDAEYYIQEEVDIALLIPKLNKNTKFLKIKKDPVEIYSEICICGYPGGNSSLYIADPTKQYTYRFSPMMQFGRISTLIPYDTQYPVKAIQTDIISSGGSSGSPIIDPSDAKVIGIATNVISGSVTGHVLLNSKYYTVPGLAKIGPVYGPSSHYFYDMVEKSLQIANGEDVRSKIQLINIENK